MYILEEDIVTSFTLALRTPWCGLLVQHLERVIPLLKTKCE